MKGLLPTLPKSNKNWLYNNLFTIFLNWSSVDILQAITDRNLFLNSNMLSRMIRLQFFQEPILIYVSLGLFSMVTQYIRLFWSIFGIGLKYKFLKPSRAQLIKSKSKPLPVLLELKKNVVQNDPIHRTIFASMVSLCRKPSSYSS